ncbi:MAG: glycosyltransferase family 2 protein [Nitrospirae bacterium]|nr:glycosyltransferase family 2 protein [Nitrospirota bacterium]
MERLTAIVPVFNEERNLDDCLRGLTWADEIMVVDSSSTDRTLEIAKRYTDRILIHEHKNPAAQRAWAVSQAAHDWVLVVDADERLTDSLQQEIRQLLKTGPALDGYRIRRVSYVWGRRIRYCGWQRDYVLRLFNRRRGQYKESEVHEEVVIATRRAGSLQHPLIHYTYRDLKHYFEKFQRYTDWGALQLYKQGKRARWDHLLLHPLFRFFRMYVLQLGFLDGIHGLVLCLLSSFYVFTKYAKLWELNRKESS